VKACSQAVDIPIHVNVGMGVGGIPMTMNAPLEIVSRASKAIVEVGKADGL
jgi:dimethylamine--corrinoid protein Co-methyltransferase